MADVKITQLPVVNTVASNDVVPVVASSTTSQLSIVDLANSLPQVTSSLTASYVENAQTASYYDLNSSNIVSSSLQFDDLTTPFTGSFTGSFVGDGSGLTEITVNAFPYTGSAEITGSLIVTGSAKVSLATYASKQYAGSFQPYNGGFGTTPLDPIDSSETASAALSWWSSPQGAGVAFQGPGQVYYSDQNIGQIGILDSNTYNRWAGAIKFLRNNNGMDIAAGKVPYYTLITDNATLIDSNASFSLVTANGRDHVLTITGSLLSRGGVSLGTSLANTHFITGSVNATGSYTQNGFLDVNGSGNFANGLNITGSLLVTGNIQGNSSIYLQPNFTNARYLEVYNTNPTDTHITASGGQIFLGDDVTYVKVDNYSSFRRIDIVADNGIYASGSLTLTGSVNITSVLNLAEMDPLPVGAIGDIAVSSSHLWFYNGNWSQLD